MVALINKNKVIFPVFAFLLRLKMKNKVIDKSEKPYFQVYIYLSRKFMYVNSISKCNFDGRIV